MKVHFEFDTLHPGDANLLSLMVAGLSARHGGTVTVTESPRAPTGSTPGAVLSDAPSFTSEPTPEDVTAIITAYREKKGTAALIQRVNKYAPKLRDMTADQKISLAIELQDELAKPEPAL